MPYKSTNVHTFSIGIAEYIKATADELNVKLLACLSACSPTLHFIDTLLSHTICPHLPFKAPRLVAGVTWWETVYFIFAKTHQTHRNVRTSVYINFFTAFQWDGTSLRPLPLCQIGITLQGVLNMTVLQHGRMQVPKPFYADELGCRETCGNGLNLKTRRKWGGEMKVAYFNQSANSVLLFRASTQLPTQRDFKTRWLPWFSLGYSGSLTSAVGNHAAAQQ